MDVEPHDQRGNNWLPVVTDVDMAVAAESGFCRANLMPYRDAVASDRRYK